MDPVRIEVRPKDGLPDPRARKAARRLGLPESAVSSGKVYYVEGDVPADEARTIAADFLADPIAEEFTVSMSAQEAVSAAGSAAASGSVPASSAASGSVPASSAASGSVPASAAASVSIAAAVTDTWAVEVGWRPGVTDNEGRVAAEILSEAVGRALSVHSSREYRFRDVPGNEAFGDQAALALGNPLLERFRVSHLAEGRQAEPWRFRSGAAPADGAVAVVDLPESDDGLAEISRKGLLALTVAEMRAIREYFADPVIGPERRAAGLPETSPTDVELEAIAQTWSEHCKHKIFNDRIRYRDETGERIIADGLFKTFIRGATEQVARERDWLVSVFTDNAGVIKFDEQHHLVFKVETHNSPSALEPYGGALTGIVGVNRDPAGTGLGCKLLFNTDVFCFAPPAWPHPLPAGVLHPERVMAGVRKGVEDGGNQSGIPTVNGAVYFDSRFLGRPLVFCGTGGLMPREVAGKPAHCKEIRPGDHVVMVGGRVGRDGIHGATFSSIQLETETPASVVQIGDPITQKRALDLLAEARERGLYRALTDNGAGGLSSSVGELALLSGGCEIALDRVPLKATGLRPWEILVSESQERMTLAVAPECWDDLAELARKRGVEVSHIGVFTDSGRFECTWDGKAVAQLSLSWLHETGLPRRTLEAEWLPDVTYPGAWTPGGRYSPGPMPGERLAQAGAMAAKVADADADSSRSVPAGDPLRSSRPLLGSEQSLPGESAVEARSRTLLALMGSLNICSREALIRQYDHEVQGGSVLKPLVGSRADGPGDAAVLRPLLDSDRAVAVSNGLAPRHGDIDPYWMAVAAVDEAVRNAVAVGADPDHLAILDNFCWPDPVFDATTNPDGRRKLGALVRACEGLRDAAVAYGTPLISGKDSVKNDFLGLRPAGQLGVAQAPLGPDAGPDALKLSVPPTLLVSAIGVVPDARQAVSMDFKVAGDLVYVVGQARDERGATEWARLTGMKGGEVPTVALDVARRCYRAVHRAICEHLVTSCHDISDGGLAVSLAESALAGELGVACDVAKAPGCEDLSGEAALYSESGGRFILSIAPGDRERFEAHLSDLPAACIGRVTAEPTVTLTANGTTLVAASVAAIKQAWQETPQW
jgi:phosphoribosylformylglycinamidine synthase